MKRQKGFFEKAEELRMFFICVCLVLAFFMWIGSCMGCKHEKPKETKIEKTIKVFDKKWEKWLNEQNDTAKNKKQ